MSIEFLQRETIVHGDCLEGMTQLPSSSVSLIIADPPYRLGKEYGNDSDKMDEDAYLQWMDAWTDEACRLLTPDGSFYIFVSWRHAPEIFVMMKRKLTMVNEIIWDRRVPSQGGSTRRFSSVHDNIGLFVKGSNYIFDLDAVRIPYDAETKKARSRKLFEGSKWLELGYNPKDVWSISRLHYLHSERENHPTQKPLELIERMVKASSKVDDLVLDPFLGSGTSGVAAARNGRRFIGFELNEEYVEISRERLARDSAQGQLFAS